MNVLVSTLTVYINGEPYTLNTELSELTGPGGRKVTDIPTDVVANMANHFQATIDDNATSLENALYATGFDPNAQPCGEESGIPCETMRVPPQATPRAKPFAPHRRQSVPRRGERAPIRNTDIRPVILRSGIEAFSASAAAGICDELAREIYSVTQRWKNEQRIAQERLRDFLYYSFGLNQIRSFTDVADAATSWTDYTTYSHRVLVSNLDLNVLATKYNLYGCWNPNSGLWSWESGGGTLPGPSIEGGTTAYGWVCHDVAVKDESGYIIGVTQRCEYIFAA